MRSQVSTFGTNDRAEFSDGYLPGMKAGSWIIEDELGRGGMGAVYAVIHETIGKRAALKVLHRRLLASSSAAAERIVFEARVVNRIQHPAVVDIFETGTMPDGRPYIVMERLDGQPLSAVSLRPVAAVDVLLQVCDALGAAHAAGIVHRDLKPDNIFLLEDGHGGATVSSGGGVRVKVLDWGIARALDHDPRHTIDGQLVGTPRYLAPEQARGEPVTFATDVYSLGVVMFELFTGRPLFDVPSAPEVMAMHLRATPPRLRDLRPELPRALDELIHATLAKSATARPAIPDVVRWLGAVRAELVSPAVEVVDLPETPAMRRRWPALVGLGAIATGVALFVVASDRKPEPEPVAPAVVATTSAPAAVVARPLPPEAPVPVPAVAATPPPAVAAVEKLRRLVPIREAPVVNDCADPAVLADGSRWLMTCTARREGHLFPIHASRDLKTWRPIGWIFPAGAPRPAWADGNYWAPELRREGSTFAAYFSMRSRDDGANALGRAAVGQLDGTTPFADDGAPILVEEGGASDANIHVDADGRRFAFFRRHRGADAIAMRELGARAPDAPPAPAAESVEVLRPTEPWEAGNVEAPWLLRHGNRYFLFYSAGRYCDGTYAIGVARASAIGGPYEKRPRPLVHSGTSTSWVGPGHASVFVGPRGVLTMAFHAYRTSEGAPRCESSTSDASEHDNDRRHAWLRAIEIVDGWPHLKDG